MNFVPIFWEGELADGHAVIIDQTKLPAVKEMLAVETVETMWDAIYHLKIRGAPAIGIAAAFGIVLGIRREKTDSVVLLREKLQQVASYLGSARPTAINLFWALERMKNLANQGTYREVEQLKLALWEEAKKILAEDQQRCYDIGATGSAVVFDNANILTHCNAGGLATSGYGTALGVIFTAFARGKKIHVYVDETRPLWQGARLTTWELKEMGVPFTLICDNTAAFVMQQKKVDMVIVGADRIAANGDVANKIGTYNLAVLAWAHGIPFFVAAPFSTFDLKLSSGAGIPIEERGAAEITNPGGLTITPPGIQVYAPAFDVTPARYISGIITEHTILRQPLAESIRKEL